VDFELTAADEGRVEELAGSLCNACLAPMELANVELGIRPGLFDVHDVQVAFTRPVFVNHFTQNWLPALPRIQDKLDAGERVLIADIGCGEGLAAVTIARGSEFGDPRVRPRRRVDCGSATRLRDIATDLDPSERPTTWNTRLRSGSHWTRNTVVDCWTKSSSAGRRQARGGSGSTALAVSARVGVRCSRS